MTFNNADHPRGHASNAGSFADKTHSAPETKLIVDNPRAKDCPRCGSAPEEFDANGNCWCESNSEEGIDLYADDYGLDPEIDDGTDGTAPPAWMQTARAVAVAAVPRTRDEATWDYYAATDKKHFGDGSEPGSKFLGDDLHTVEDVIELAILQRESLHGDDRDLFIARGSHVDAFQDGNRYLFVKTPGTVGVIHSADLPDATLLSVVRTKPGAPCSLVAAVDEQPMTSYACIIVSTDKDTGEDLVITTFPGIVTQSIDNELIESLEGGALTVASARDIIGTDFWANSRVVPHT